MTLSGDAAVARAAALVPVLRQRSAATNAARRVPDETMRDLEASGLLRLLQPARYGGHESDRETFVRVAIELSKGCGSAGWVYSVLTIHSWLVGMFPDRAQQEVWGAEPNALAASSFAPTGKARRIEGGFVLDGTWGYCSGCDNSRWVVVSAALGMTGEPPRPDRQMLMVPLADCTIDDNWHVLGLRGTGSKNLVLKDVFVPEHRALDYFAAREGRGPGTAANPGPLYRLPAWALFPVCLAAPSVGIAWGALERFIEHAQGRTTRHAGHKITGYATVQMRVAEAAAMTDAAELLLRRDVREAMAASVAGTPVPLALRVQSRRDEAYAALMATGAVEKLFRACGALGLFDDFELQQSFRDVNATAAHVGTNWDAAGTLYGTFTLGITPAETNY